MGLVLLAMLAQYGFPSAPPPSPPPAAITNGFSAIGGNAAIAQTFKSPGGAVKHVMLLLARQNDLAVSTPLVVELRDPSLKQLYFRGSVPGEKAKLDFAWVDVKPGLSKPLPAGVTLVLVLSSPGTAGAWWVAHTVYRDDYADGELVGICDHDLSFRVVTSEGKAETGPDSLSDRPVNSNRYGEAPRTAGRPELMRSQRMYDAPCSETKLVPMGPIPDAK
ncbi:MAG: hypothetical protein U0228_28475 [Myxococcaceae bacterium]